MTSFLGCGMGRLLFKKRSKSLSPYLLCSMAFCPFRVTPHILAFIQIRVSLGAAWQCTARSPFRFLNHCMSHKLMLSNHQSPGHELSTLTRHIASTNNLRS